MKAAAAPRPGGAPLLAALAALSVAGGTRRRPQASGVPKSWGYTYAGEDGSRDACSRGRHQSPIDLPKNAPKKAPEAFLFEYPVHFAPLVDLGGDGRIYSFEFFGPGYGGIFFDDDWHNLISVNVQLGSQHTFGGKHTAVELHLVHRINDGNSYAVVVLLLDCAKPPTGYKFVPPGNRGKHVQPILDLFLRAPLPGPHKKITVPLASTLDLTPLLRGGMFFRYAGSLTAPPCSEVVTWFVRTEPTKISGIQAQQLYNEVLNATGGPGAYRAYRPTSPLNGRKLSVVRAVQDVPRASPASAPALSPSPSPAVQSAREVAVGAITDQAMRIATAAWGNLRSVDKGLRRAAEEEADRMSELAAAADT